MLLIPIINIPNQSLTLQVDNNQYDLVIHATQDNADGTSGIMAIDVSINNVTILSGIRAVSFFPLIPYDYLVNGNFIFITQNFEYPDWRKFGITQNMFYVSNDELEAINNGTFTA